MTTYDEYGVPVGAYSESESLTAQAGRLVKALFTYRIRPFAERRYNALRRGDWSFRRLFTLVNVLVVIWCYVLYWGERSVFKDSIESCNWDRWEKWEPGANPHHLIFVADPQLIDPHTYPGRPWPLNPLTYKYTDLYLRRTYSRFQTILYPDTIFFLGDLFDGGREWSTLTTESPDITFHKYGDEFWLKEYRRFSDIFFKHWGDGGMDPRPGQAGRKIISGLPGNHDLGFARGVQLGVRNRFNAYFGDGNRIDIIANHTFVSIDSVSLSAFGQENPHEVEDLWRPTQTFVDNAKKQKKRLIQRELRSRRGLRPYPPFLHYEIEAEDLPKAELPHADDDVTDFPTVLLSHVPLYRNPGTPCGPLREHWPPSPPSAGQPHDHDDRNAIAVRGGYQYQNVLNREITADIAQKIGDIRYAFSGDDHDYCQVVHRGYASAGGGIKEITVKAISWAMGVRLPGIVLASLWNPVDEDGNPLSGDASKTIQTHLCLLPDQIGTFLKYGMLFGLTLTLLVIRAGLITAGIIAVPVSNTPQESTSSSSSSLLPTSNPSTTSSAESEKQLLSSHPAFDSPTSSDQTGHSANSSTSSERSGGTLQVRSAQARTRSISPGVGINPNHLSTSSSTSKFKSKYSYPLVQYAGFYGNDDDIDDDDIPLAAYSANPYAARNAGKVKIHGRVKEKKKAEVPKKRKGAGLFWFELRSSLAVVLAWGLPWYGWLVLMG